MIILFKRNFKKRFQSLSKPIQEKFYTRLELFEKNPFHLSLNNHSLHGEYTNCRSINITGDYRAVYEAINNETVEFITIGTHSELYS